VITLDAIGTHCISEKTAGRPVPTEAHLSPTEFQRLAREHNAKIFYDDGGEWLQMVTAAGPVRVVSDAAQTGSDIRYEVS
jgi:hypothetical protein